MHSQALEGQDEGVKATRYSRSEGIDSSLDLDQIRAADEAIESLSEESEIISEEEEGLVPIVPSASLFGLLSKTQISPSPSPQTTLHKRRDTPKGPRLSLRELSVERFPIPDQMRVLSPTDDRPELVKNLLLSSAQRFALTIDSPNTMPRRGYLTRYEYLQHWKAHHLRHRHRPSSPATKRIKEL
jgi:hypothetical protein